MTILPGDSSSGRCFTRRAIGYCSTRAGTRLILGRGATERAAGRRLMTRLTTRLLPPFWNRRTFDISPPKMRLTHITMTVGSHPRIVRVRELDWENREPQTAEIPCSNVQFNLKNDNQLHHFVNSCCLTRCGRTYGLIRETLKSSSRCF